MADYERCCCNLVHVKTGTWIIAIVQLVLVVIGVVQGIGGFVHEMASDRQVETKIALLVQAIFLVIFLLLVILLMIGLYKNRARYVFPHLIACVVMFIVMIVEAVLIIIAGTTLAHLTYMVIFGLFLLYCLWIEYMCYKYLNSFA